MYDYGTFSFESKAQVLEQAKTFWNPDKTQFWTDVGVDLVIDRREGYFLWDMSGRRLIDMHLNGGTYNLGHRNPEIMAGAHRGHGATSMSATTTFPRWPGRRWREKLVESAPASITKVAFGSGGGEAIDIALKSARHATKRRKIVSIVKAYHGHTGWRWPPATTGSRSFPVRPARRVHPGAVRRCRRDGAGALRR